jgi:hypothetical protein
LDFFSKGYLRDLFLDLDNLLDKRLSGFDLLDKRLSGFDLFDDGFLVVE